MTRCFYSHGPINREDFSKHQTRQRKLFAEEPTFIVESPGISIKYY